MPRVILYHYVLLVVLINSSSSQITDLPPKYPSIDTGSNAGAGDNAGGITRRKADKFGLV